MSGERRSLGPSDFLRLVKGFLKVIGIVLLSVAVLASIVWLGNPPGDRGSEAFLANALEMAEGHIVRLDDFREFDWDRVCKTGGYGGTRETEELIDADWNHWWWYIPAESLGQLIFMHDDEVVASFLDQKYFIPVWQCYERSEAVFQVTQLPSGEHWLKPWDRR